MNRSEPVFSASVFETERSSTYYTNVENHGAVFSWPCNTHECWCLQAADCSDDIERDAPLCARKPAEVSLAGEAKQFEAHRSTASLSIVLFVVSLTIVYSRGWGSVFSVLPAAMLVLQVYYFSGCILSSLDLSNIGVSNP
jgi:hypothetical protein